MKRSLAVALLIGWAGASRAPAQDTFGLPLRGEAAETFLKTAEVVRKKGLGQGITLSDQYTLSDGTRTLKAVWKTIDEFKRGVTRLEGGGVFVDLADSWKHEVASYELDKLLGTGLVPPTVERTFDRKKGLAPDVGGGSDDGGGPQAEEAWTRPTPRPGTGRCTRCGCSTSSPTTPTPATSATC